MGKTNFLYGSDTPSVWANQVLVYHRNKSKLLDKQEYVPFGLRVRPLSDYEYAPVGLRVRPSRTLCKSLQRNEQTAPIYLYHYIKLSIYLGVSVYLRIFV